MIILTTVVIYFVLLYLLSRLTARRSTNATFFTADKRSPWYMVAFGMVGASISGVTFVSVPGMVLRSDMTYLQTCMGFIVGYIVVARLLLPIYYRHNLTSIYTYLGHRLGRRSYKTAAWFFLIAKLTGSAVKFYVVCILLQRFVLDALGVPFVVTIVAMVALIWLYTHRGGIKTLVWTDSFQTLCLFAALVLIIGCVAAELKLDLPATVRAVAADSHSRIFVFDDWMSTQNFFKQFVSGIFIVIVMTGLDQDMMQKNLTCKSLGEAQKDMTTYGFAFLPANLLFLALGILLVQLAAREGIALPAQGDELLPMFAATGRLGETVVVLFTIGIVAASFSSADSALTALTTSFCVDICGRTDDERLRRLAHIGICTAFVVFILGFRAINSTSVIDAIYILVGYTYGPLLGLFAFGLFTRRSVADRRVPLVCIVSPLLCWCISEGALLLWQYKFGYELLMLNGLLTFAGLAIGSRSISDSKNNRTQPEQCTQPEIIKQS